MSTKKIFLTLAFIICSNFIYSNASNYVVNYTNLLNECLQVIKLNLEIDNIIIDNSIIEFRPDIFTAWISGQAQRRMNQVKNEPTHSNYYQYEKAINSLKRKISKKNQIGVTWKINFSWIQNGWIICRLSKINQNEKYKRDKSNNIYFLIGFSENSITTMIKVYERNGVITTCEE